MNRIHPSLAFALVFAVAALAVRFSPVPTNVALMGGLSLFAGCYLRGWKAWALPLGCMALSDLIGHWGRISDMGFYHPATMISVYLGYACIVALGGGLRRAGNEQENDHPLWVVSASGLGSIAFFIISNFGSWLDPQMGYENSFAGLMQCYWMALPFFRGTVMSDLFASALFFGSYQLLRGLPVLDQTYTRS